MGHNPNVTEIVGTFIIDTLPTPNAGLVGKYARVTDLFGEKTDLLLCSNLGSSYYWQPVRTIYAKSASIAGANMTLTPLKSASVMFLTGTLVANRTVQLSETGVWPGCSFEIAMDGTLGLFTLTILGVNLGAGLSLLLSGRR